MNDLDTKSLSFDAYDELRHPRPAEQDFDRVVTAVNPAELGLAPAA